MFEYAQITLCKTLTVTIKDLYLISAILEYVKKAYFDILKDIEAASVKQIV